MVESYFIHVADAVRQGYHSIRWAPFKFHWGGGGEVFLNCIIFALYALYKHDKHVVKF